MGWSTNLFCNIEFHKKTYNNKYDVEERIQQLNEIIDSYKNCLYSYIIMTEPTKYFGEDPLDTINCNFKDIMESLEECYIERYKLELLIDNWDNCHKDGLAIAPPDSIKWNTAYLDGDFIKTTNV